MLSCDIKCTQTDPLIARDRTNEQYPSDMYRQQTKTSKESRDITRLDAGWEIYFRRYRKFQKKKEKHQLLGTLLTDHRTPNVGGLTALTARLQDSKEIVVNIYKLFLRRKWMKESNQTNLPDKHLF